MDVTNQSEPAPFPAGISFTSPVSGVGDALSCALQYQETDKPVPSKPIQSDGEFRRSFTIKHIRKNSTKPIHALCFVSPYTM